MADGPQPVMHLLVSSRENPKKKGRVGAAWPNDYGGYRIVLNPGTELRWDDEIYISLVPNTYAERGESSRKRIETAPPPVGDEQGLGNGSGDDDLPF